VRVEIDTSASKVPGEGEIIVYGPNVMKGYLNRPEETAQVLLADGGFRTGDLGFVDRDGFLFITGRIKEQYKLENGKYVMPSPLEEALKLSPFISNAMVFGDNRPFNVAIVVPNVEAIRAWAASDRVLLGADHTVDPEVRRLLRSEIDRCAADFKTYERPLEFVIAREDFTCENGALTPTLKLKRRLVVERFSQAIEALYGKAGEDSVLLAKEGDSAGTAGRYGPASSSRH
jgi:long-chain acyl-CoA synthetase